MILQLIEYGELKLRKLVPVDLNGQDFREYLNEHDLDFVYSNDFGCLVLVPKGYKKDNDE